MFKYNLSAMGMGRWQCHMASNQMGGMSTFMQGMEGEHLVSILACEEMALVSSGGQSNEVPCGSREQLSQMLPSLGPGLWIS